MDPPGPSRDVGGGLLRSLETDQVSRLEKKARVHCHCQLLGTDLWVNHGCQLPGKFQLGICRGRGGVEEKGQLLCSQDPSWEESPWQNSKYLPFLLFLR